jgi:hypothetical protein
MPGGESAGGDFGAVEIVMRGNFRSSPETMASRL